eukprot:588218-Pleurochrysis_carterae.AAC.3
MGPSSRTCSHEISDGSEQMGVGFKRFGGAKRWSKSGGHRYGRLLRIGMNARGAQRRGRAAESALGWVAAGGSEPNAEG